MKIKTNNYGKDEFNTIKHISFNQTKLCNLSCIEFFGKHTPIKMQDHKELNIYFGHEIPAREQIMFGTQLCIHLSNKQTVVKPMLTEGLSYEL